MKEEIFYIILNKKKSIALPEKFNSYLSEYVYNLFVFAEYYVAFFPTLIEQALRGPMDL